MNIAAAEAPRRPAVLLPRTPARSEGGRAMVIRSREKPTHGNVHVHCHSATPSSGGIYTAVPCVGLWWLCRCSLPRARACCVVGCGKAPDAVCWPGFPWDRTEIKW